MIMPVLFEDQLLGVIELAWLRAPSEIHRTFLEQLMETLGVVLNTIIANMRTEELLEQSQSLNAELEQQAQMLEERNLDIERKNREIEQARIGLEEKAEQLAQSGRYKSEFLANMSHELRTPLNSLLILSKLLLDNESGNLTDKQLEFARTIRAAGSDLLELINDILDLSKIEAGQDGPAARRAAGLGRQRLRAQHLRAGGFGQGASRSTSCSPTTCRALIVTDQQRLQQILRNLLSNAFKFTAQGGVTLRDRARRRRCDHLRGDRHRHRHRRGQAGGDLRGLPAGGRHHQPHLRRHRARSLDQPRARARPGRRAQREQHARGGEHVHPHAAARCGRQSSGGGGREQTRSERRGSGAGAAPARAADDDSAGGHRP